MINVKNITKKYPRYTVFQDFSLSILKNRTTCILGESGCGKTTLLNVIANLTDYQGHVDKVSCSYAFQKPNLFKNLTVKQNLKIVGATDDDAYKILQTVELSDKIDAYPNHLSGGQAQRVSLARALIKKADVLLMDEPFSSLDIKTKTLLIKRFNDIFTNNPRTVVFVTHDVDEALALADTIIVLKDKNADFILNLTQDKSTRVYGEDVEKRKIIFDYLKK